MEMWSTKRGVPPLPDVLFWFLFVAGRDNIFRKVLITLNWFYLQLQEFDCILDQAWASWWLFRPVVSAFLNLQPTPLWKLVVEEHSSRPLSLNLFPTPTLPILFPSCDPSYSTSYPLLSFCGMWFSPIVPSEYSGERNGSLLIILCLDLPLERLQPVSLSCYLGTEFPLKWLRNPVPVLISSSGLAPGFSLRH